jgi:hypothetical protein
MNVIMYVLNRIGTTLDGMTPFEALFQMKPLVAHIRVFGSNVYFHVAKELTTQVIAIKRKRHFLTNRFSTTCHLQLCFN